MDRDLRMTCGPVMARRSGIATVRYPGGWKVIGDDLVAGGDPPAGPSPVVTVITPTFRRDPLIVRRCCYCMMLQDIADWEQIVCSDGEDEPAIRAMIASLGDPRIRYCHTTRKKPGDYGHTIRNALIARARGRYVMFFDDDNVIAVNYVSRMAAALDAGSHDFAVCRIVHFGPLNVAEVGPPPKVLTGIPVKLYHIDTLQVMARTDFMKSCGWNTEMGYVSDGVTFENMARRSSRGYAVVPEILGYHL